MTTNNNKQQVQPQAGPIAQQLAKIQTNGQQVQFNGQQPSAGQPKKRTANWTGFSGKTLWDWLPLLIQLLTALALPVALFLATQWFSTQQSQVSMRASDRQHQTDLQIAGDQQKENALQTYLDRMSELLLNNNLRKSQPGDEVRNVARARTITVLPQLDGVRKGELVHFLREAGLIDSKNTIVSLDGADLTDIVLPFTTDSSGTNLSDINLSGANLFRAELGYANLNGANLNGILLFETDLKNATLIHANLSSAHIDSATLTNANLTGATLTDATLTNANLSKADLRGANLNGALLCFIKLSNDKMHMMHITYIAIANLSGSNLRDADLNKAWVTQEQLKEVESLQGAIMPDGSKHP